MEHHCGERANCWKVCGSLNSVLCRVKDESGISSVLSVESSEDEHAGARYLVAHGQVTRDPIRHFAQLNNVPDFLVNVIELTHISDLFGIELNSA